MEGIWDYIFYMMYFALIILTVINKIGMQKDDRLEAGSNADIDRGSD